MSENVLYTLFGGKTEYFPASVVKCDVCNEMFQIRKGFYLKEDVLSCFKHDINNGECESEVENTLPTISTGSDDGVSNS